MLKVCLVCKLEYESDTKEYDIGCCSTDCNIKYADQHENVQIPCTICGTPYRENTYDPCCSIKCYQKYVLKIEAESIIKEDISDYYKRTYDITLSDWISIYVRQNGKCAICGLRAIDSKSKGDKLCVDHDHTTGKVRGLLCSTCNSGLGMFKDSTKNLKNAIKYLKEHDYG